MEWRRRRRLCSSKMVGIASSRSFGCSWSKEIFLWKIHCNGNQIQFFQRRKNSLQTLKFFEKKRKKKKKKIKKFIFILFIIILFFHFFENYESQNEDEEWNQRTNDLHVKSFEVHIFSLCYLFTVLVFVLFHLFSNIKESLATSVLFHFLFNYLIYFIFILFYFIFILIFGLHLLFQWSWILCWQNLPIFFHISKLQNLSANQKEQHLSIPKKEINKQYLKK